MIIMVNVGRLVVGLWGFDISIGGAACRSPTSNRNKVDR